MKLSSLSLAMLPLLSVFSVNAAVYSIVDLGTEASQVKSTYAAALNDSGDTLIHGYGIYDFPLDLDSINFDSDAIKAILTEEQINDARNGVVTAQVLSTLTNFLYSNSSVAANQKIGQVIALTKTGNSNITVQKLRDTAGIYSNNEYLYAVNNNGAAVGLATATYTRQEFTPAPTETTPDPQMVKVWVPDAMYQAGMLLNNGQVSVLPAPYQELGGGFSVAKAISNTGLIVGHGSTGMPEAVYENIEENCDGKTTPQALCFYNSAVSGSYIQRALSWQLEAGGSVSAPQSYGFLGDKNSGQPHSREDYAAITYTSTANAVNDNGLIAGQSVYSDSDRITCVSVDIYGYCNAQGVSRANHATLYNGSEVEAMIDPLEWSSSDATVINNNDIVAGYATKVINSANRRKFFYYDYNTKQTVFPDDFFASSSSVPADINDQGQIVGRGEVMIGGTASRRLHAFLYDIPTDTFSDLNKLIGCDAPYTLVEANAINNNGEILATAIVEREAKNAKGEAIIDSSGNPVMEEVTTTLKLAPIPNGEAEDCGTNDNNYDRKGGSIGWFPVLLAGLLFLRRRK
ncbi:DUF3466 family protein [Chromatiaceae bacterium AAb-1]|nr:DUF3466 family protein [Chromatiaceae bacterium AAb-1]